MTLVSSGIKIAKIVGKFAYRAKSLSTGESFVIKHFPPGYRDTARTIIRGADIALTGSVISEILNGFNDGQIPTKYPPGKFKKEYSGSKYGSSRYNKYSFRQRMRRCRPSRPRRRRRSYYR